MGIYSLLNTATNLNGTLSTSTKPDITAKKLDWDIEIEGQSFKDSGLDQYVEAVEYTVEKNLMTRMNITLLNPLVENNNSTKSIFGRGRMLSFYVGWGERKYIGTCLVEHASIDTRGERITFQCRDKGKEMARIEKDATYPNTLDSQIVMKKALEYGFTPIVDATVGTVSRIQRHESDYRLLNSLAAKNGYAFYVQYNPTAKIWELHFEKPKTLNQQTAFEYKYAGTDSSVISFDPEITGETHRATKVTLYAYMLDERKELKLEKDTKPEKLMTFTADVAGNESVESLERRFQNEAEAKAYLEKLVKSREEAYMTARASVIGNTELKCLEFVYFGGLTFAFFDDISGYWRIEGVTHKVYPQDTVFTTALDLTRIQMSATSSNSFIGPVMP